MLMCAMLRSERDLRREHCIILNATATIGKVSLHCGYMTARTTRSCSCMYKCKIDGKT